MRKEPRTTIDVAKFVRTAPLSSRRLGNIAKAVWQDEAGGPAQISIVVVGDVRMANLTERYVGRRYRTDVLAFELSDPSDEEAICEVVINSALARDSGKKRGIDPGAELALYLIHGLLHLRGYDDSSAEERKQMHRRGLDHLRRARFRITASLATID